MRNITETSSTGTSDASIEQQREAFDKVVAKSKEKAESPKETSQKLEAAKATLSSPEQIWKEAADAKARAAARREAKAEKTEEPKEEPEQKPVAKAKEPEPEQDEAEEEEEDPELERARTALIRSGFKKKELAAMSHKEVLNRGLARARALDAIDEAWNAAKTAKAQKPTDAEAKTDAGTTQADSVLPDMKSALKPLADQLLLDDRGAAALESAFKAILTPLVEKIGSQQAPSPQIQQANDLLSASRKELQGVYPGLLDPVIFDQAVEMAEKLAGNPKYRSLKSAQEAYTAVLRDACDQIGVPADYEPDDDEEDTKDRDAERKTRRMSRSTPSGKAKVQNVESSDPDRLAFDYLSQNPGDVRGATKAARRA